MRLNACMGRDKARKPKKQRSRSDTLRLDPLAKLFSSYEVDELWHLLFAAASSPSARHRSASIGSALAAALRAQSSSPRHAHDALPAVQELVDRAADKSDIDGMQEDFIPKDPTQSVVMRVGDSLRSSVPGSTERPVADLARALRFAQALDVFLIRRHGFGLSNVIRVVYNWADTATTALSSSLVPAPDVELGDQIEIPASELEATRRLVSTDPLTTFDLRGSDIAALEWMTTSSDKAHFDASSTNSPFGWHLRYRSSVPEQADRWLPPTYMPEILAGAVSELVSTLDRDQDARLALRASCLEETRRALWRFSSAIYEANPLKDGSLPLKGQDVQWIVPVNPTASIAISMVYTDDLTGPIRAFGSEKLAQKAAGSKEPIVVRLGGGGQLTLPPDTEIIPLVVFAGPGHLAVPQRNGLATLALEDLTWIAETADDNDDLYLFARDLSSPDFPSNFGWEAINYWEPWRSNGKTFFAGGISPSYFHFEAHAGDAEWERSAELSPLEAALHQVGLPPLRSAHVAEISFKGTASAAVPEGQGRYDPETGIHTAPPVLGWSLALTNPPVAIARSSPQWKPDEHYRFLSDLSGGLVFGFAALSEAWNQVHENMSVSGYLVELASSDSSGVGRAQNARVVNPGVIDHQSAGACVVRWTIDIEKFVEAADGNPQAANELTADAFVELLELSGISPDDIRDLHEEWLTSEPFLILETSRSKTALHNLPLPFTLSPADESSTIALSARRLSTSGVEPGTYRGTAANDLVQRHLAPQALAELTDRIAAHDVQDVISTGMEQLNRVMDDGMRQRGDLARVATHLATEWNPQKRMKETMGETLKLRQCNEIIVEAALLGASKDKSQAPITARTWSGLLAAANSYRTMTTISERLHHRVTPMTIEITPAYEIYFDDDDQPEPGSWKLDVDALDMAAAGSHLRPGDLPETQEGSSLAALDLAMIQTDGASREDLFQVLIALIRWDHFSDGASVAYASEASVLDWIHSVVGDPTESQRSRLKQAFKLLTITSDQLRASSWEPWQTRTRRHRLLIQPIVQSDDGRLIIAPQYLLTSLSVYNNHLSQGVLPWTGGIPPEVGRALEQVRDARNKEFEKTLAGKLVDAGFRTITRVKPGDHDRLGVPANTTEIDLVAGRPGDDTIWLIEAKDPASVHAVAETARQLRTFFRDSTSKGKVKPSYSTQLARKEAELKPYVDRVAAKLGLNARPADTPYVLSTLFVTRTLVPAGYVGERFPVETTAEFLGRWAPNT